MTKLGSKLLVIVWEMSHGLYIFGKFVGVGLLVLWLVLLLLLLLLFLFLFLLFWFLFLLFFDSGGILRWFGNTKCHVRPLEV